LVVLNLLVDEEPKTIVADEGASSFGKANYFLDYWGFVHHFKLQGKKCIWDESTLRWLSFNRLKSLFKVLVLCS
jgi:hypothetical protein